MTNVAWRLRLQGARALANLAAHGNSNSNNSAVGQEAGALEALVQPTHSPHEGVRQEAAGALWNLSFDDRNREAIASAGGVEALAMAQVSGLVLLQAEVGGSRDSFVFVGIDKVRFRKLVIAGDTLVMRMTLFKLQKRFGIAKMDGKAYVGGDLVCEGEFLMALGSSSSE